jgi:hypothetical protein
MIFNALTFLFVLLLQVLPHLLDLPLSNPLGGHRERLIIFLLLCGEVIFPWVEEATTSTRWGMVGSQTVTDRFLRLNDLLWQLHFEKNILLL